MQAQTVTSDGKRGPQQISIQQLTNWFVPVGLLHSRANRGMAQIFVQTHFLAAAAALATTIFLFSVASVTQVAFYVILAAALIFAALPFVLRRTGSMPAVALVSFLTLTVASLVGTYDYGGLSSPFLPWLLVSLMSGLFYQSSRTALILGLFASAVALFFLAIVLAPPSAVSVKSDELQLLSWISIGVAMAYMAVMALYYSRITASRSELELEAERYRTASIELEQARAVADKVSRNRSLFFAKMSHELRTPLNAVINYSEMLLEDCEDDPNAKSQRMADLNRINATGKHLLSLVSGVFDMEDLDARSFAADVRRFDLGTLCDIVVATAEPLMAKNANKLVVDCPIRSDVVNTDDQKLRQMLLNLLSNAAKFTSNGTVTLELWIERGLADDRIHAAVRDTGIGIAPDVLPRLFETYMQADATIYDRFGGTGIGLALTRKFSVLLGGDVSVVSRVGAGSTFTIDVPAELKRPSVTTSIQSPKAA
jgi:signal transduction histidine kinase